MCPPMGSLSSTEYALALTRRDGRHEILERWISGAHCETRLAFVAVVGPLQCSAGQGSDAIRWMAHVYVQYHTVRQMTKQTNKWGVNNLLCELLDYIDIIDRHS